MNQQQLDQLDFIKNLCKVVIDNKLECLEVENIVITKSKHMQTAITKLSNQSNELPPSEDEIMSWSLSEPIPPESALAKALSSEPKRQRTVRKQIATDGVE